MHGGDADPSWYFAAQSVLEFSPLTEHGMPFEAILLAFGFLSRAVHCRENAVEKDEF